jgi:hypothetical protein
VNDLQFADWILLLPSEATLWPKTGLSRLGFAVLLTTISSLKALREARQEAKFYFGVVINHQSDLRFLAKGSLAFIEVAKHAEQPIASQAASTKPRA